MEKIAVGLWNNDVQFVEGENIFLFYNEEQAYAQLSRALRDGYVHGEMTEDWLKSHKYVQVGVFDSVHAEFKAPENVKMVIDFSLDCWQTVKDLKEDDND